MKKILTVTGMTCNNCAAGVKRRFEAIPGVVSANVALPNSAVVEVEGGAQVPLAAFTQALSGTRYIAKFERPSPFAFLRPFVPLIVMFTIVLAWATVLNYPLTSEHAVHNFMRHFMSGFFLLFGLLKVVNLRSFASMYNGYDLLAKRVPAWGYAYPFVELALGVLYTIDVFAFQANVATAVLMIFGSVGIVAKLQSGKQQTCACLGGFFAVPLTWVTVAENLLMAAMAVYMLFAH